MSEITAGYDVTNPEPGLVEGGSFGPGWTIQYNPSTGRYEPVYTGTGGSGGTGGGTSGGPDPNYDPANPTNIPPPGAGVTPGSGAVGAGGVDAAGGGFLGNLFGGMDAGDYGKLLSTLIGVYGSLRGNRFHQAPDPLTDALRARIFGFIDNSPTRNVLGTALQDYIKGGANQAQPMLPDKYGYSPYPNGAPKYDLSNVLAMIQASMTPQRPQAPQTPHPQDPPPDYRTPNPYPNTTV